MHTKHLGKVLGIFLVNKAKETWEHVSLFLVAIIMAALILAAIFLFVFITGGIGWMGARLLGIPFSDFGEAISAGCMFLATVGLTIALSIYGVALKRGLVEWISENWRLAKIQAKIKE